jgi:hypothetical protein
MKKTFLLFSLLLITSLACSLGGLSGGDAAPTQAPRSENRCGDSVCDGPENPQNCPADCAAAGASGGQGSSTPGEMPAPGADPTAIPEAGYRYVSFGGSIYTTLNTATMGDFTGKAFEYSGKYQIELWFPMSGGESVRQRNTITLTEFKDLYFGYDPCAPCEWTLDESAFEPVAFELDASLNLNGIQEGDQPADELVYQLVEMPQAVITGVVFCPCPHSVPGDFSDPAAFPQMLGWFMQKLVNPIQLNALERNSVENFAVSPMGFVSIPEENLSYVIVPNLETP